MNRLNRWLAPAAALLALAAPAALGQAEIDGPTALITTYHAKPESRAKLRKLMQTTGVAQFDKWKKAGVFASYQLLYSAYAGDTSPDMYLVLKFNHFHDLGAWQKIEETSPGGLPAEAQAMATPEYTATADIVRDKSTAATTANSQFFVLEYDVLVDMPKYQSYVSGYAVPQFDKWAATGAVSSYSCFTNQNPAGAPFGSFFVLEYKDLPSLAAREVIKTKARQELMTSDAAWKKWSDDKTAVRKEKAAVAVLSLN